MKFTFPKTDDVIEWIHPQVSGGKDVEDSKVAVLLEDLRAQFQVFGEGLEAIKQDVSGLKQDVSGLKQEVSELKQEFAQERRLNRQEHRQMMQMIQELARQFQDELKRAR